MPRNPARRDDLLDAGLAVLADSGARGLTFRAVDARAGVPTGTASNYFTDRDALLAELGERIHLRLAPAPAELAAIRSRPPSPELTPTLMRELLDRVLGRREIHIALLELRLEATRRPALRAALTRTVARMFAGDVAFHAEVGSPGGATTVALLHHAMEGLILDRLTLPDALGTTDPGATAELLARAVLAQATPPDPTGEQGQPRS